MAKVSSRPRRWGRFFSVDILGVRNIFRHRWFGDARNAVHAALRFGVRYPGCLVDYLRPAGPKAMG